MDSSAEIASLSDFIEQLKAGGLIVGEPPVWYRGSSDVEHELVPSVFRPPRNGDNETLMIKRFMQDAHPLLPDTQTPPSHWDWLFIAQHHGVPTRVLDWTESPLVGLYFATQPASSDPDDPERPGGLWVLSPQTLNTHTLNVQSLELPMFGFDTRLEGYAPLTAAPTAVHLKPAAALAVRSFLRISAQWGTFTIHSNATALEDEAFSPRAIRKFSVAASAKATIRDELQTIGVDDRTVFPDLHHLGRSVRGRY
jgi:hypothetical protein